MPLEQLQIESLYSGLRVNMHSMKIAEVREKDGGHWLICPSCKRKMKLVFTEKLECWKCLKKRAAVAVEKPNSEDAPAQSETNANAGSAKGGEGRSE